MKAVWQGKLALWKQFWLYGAAGGLTLHLLLGVLFMGLTESPEDSIAIWLLGLLFFVMLYSIWAFVGIWRSAGNYSGPKDWVIAARGAVLFGLFLYLTMIIAVLMPVD
jgi:hypothetical protein